MLDAIAIILTVVLLIAGLIGSRMEGREAYYNERVEHLKKRQKRRLLKRGKAYEATRIIKDM